VSLPVGFRPEALDDVLLAREWYERQSPDLGQAFATRVEQLLDRIAATPELYAATFRNVRPAKLRRFPYVVYYRFLATASRCSRCYTGVVIPAPGKNGLSRLVGG